MKRLRQKAIGFQFTDLHEASFNDYLQRKLEQQEKCKLRTEIDLEVAEWQKIIPKIPGMDVGLQGYENYFNYQLNTRTWRSFVNKQIL